MFALRLQLCLFNLFTMEWSDGSRRVLTVLSAVSPDYLPAHGQMVADGLSHNIQEHTLNYPPTSIPQTTDTNAHTHTQQSRKSGNGMIGSPRKGNRIWYNLISTGCFRSSAPMTREETPKWIIHHSYSHIRKRKRKWQRKQHKYNSQLMHIHDLSSFWDGKFKSSESS